MTEFRDTVKRIGTSQAHIARMLGVTDRSVRRWYAGDAPVPETVRRVLHLIETVPAARGYLDSCAYPVDDR